MLLLGLHHAWGEYMSHARLQHAFKVLTRHTPRCIVTRERSDPAISYQLALRHSCALEAEMPSSHAASRTPAWLSWQREPQPGGLAACPWAPESSLGPDGAGASMTTPQRPAECQDSQLGHADDHEYACTLHQQAYPCLICGAMQHTGDCTAVLSGSRTIPTRLPVVMLRTQNTFVIILLCYMRLFPATEDIKSQRKYVCDKFIT